MGERMAAEESDLTPEPLFERTRELSYSNRRRALLAEENDGEPAVIVDPYESPLWFVDHYDPSKLRAASVDMRERFKAMAEKTNGLAADLFGDHSDSPTDADSASA